VVAAVAVTADVDVVRAPRNGDLHRHSDSHRAAMDTPQVASADAETEADAAASEAEAADVGEADATEGEEEADLEGAAGAAAAVVAEA